MSDIVERLRWPVRFILGDERVDADRTEAADEIDRLRRALAALVDLEPNGLFVTSDAWAIKCLDDAKAALAATQEQPATGK